MEALKQYLDLYTAHRDLIESHSCAPLNRLRDEAFRELAEHPLPRKGSENYEATDIAEMISPDFGLNIADVPLEVNRACTFRCAAPLIQSHLLVVDNDTINIPTSLTEQLPEGVELRSLRDLGREEPEFLVKYYGSLASIGNPIVALDTMLLRDGICLRVRKRTRLERPLQIVNILAAAAPLMAVRRMLVVIEEDAEAKVLVCNHTQSVDLDMMDLGVVEIYVGRGARFDYYEMEESTEKTRRLSALYLRQEESSRVTVDSMTIYNGTTRNEFHTHFAGENGSLRLLGFGIADSNRSVSVLSRIDHQVARCHSDELFKFSVDDHAAADFTGRIHVAHGAVKTEAYQSCRNLVGSAEAKVNSKPQLEIYNDDVKCSHGSAIGQLDPLQLFYMRTRGLDEAAATLLLKQAFMADVIEGVEIPTLRERLHTIVEQRFAGTPTGCLSNCAAHE